MNRRKVGFAGSDGRTLLSAVEVSRSTREKEYQGVVIRGMPAMKPFAELMNWPVEFIDVPGNTSVPNYVDHAIEALANKEIDYIIPMPEALQIDGFVNKMIEAGYSSQVAGLTAEGSFLEGNKARCKQFCEDAGVPVAREWTILEAWDFKSFRVTCLRYLDLHGGVYVKFPFQAAGKGSRFINNPWDIREVYDTLLADYADVYKQMFGEGRKWPLLLESYMAGMEVSFTALVDANGNFQILPTAMDYPGRFPGAISKDNPITGGMAAIGSHPMESPELLHLAARCVFRPLIQAMKTHGILRPCILYPGCMVFFDHTGKPQSIRVCEINIRPPEPEFQVMIRLVRNFGELMVAMFEGNLDEVKPEVRPGQICMSLALVTGPGPGSEYKGYPWRHKPGEPMELDLKGLKKNQVTLLPAGMGYRDGTFISDGTRVAYLIANATLKTGQTYAQAAALLREKLYRVFNDGKVRVVPTGDGEDPAGNRLTVRSDVALHFDLAERLFAS